MTEAVRAANPMIDNYIEGRAVDIDIEQRRIKVKLEDLQPETRFTARDESERFIDVEYDKLVVAVGCKVADSMVPGAAQFALKLKTCDDARLLRNAVGECLEYASRPEVAPEDNLAESEELLRREKRRKRLTFCIVGGGPTGVELAGKSVQLVTDYTSSMFID